MNQTDDADQPLGLPGEGVRLEDGDVMEIELAGFGRALRNPIRAHRAKPEFVAAKQL